MSRGILVLLVAIAVATPLSAQRPPRSGEAIEIHPEARAAIDGIKSPYCPGQMLVTCPSPGAAQIRDSIQLMATEGFSSDEIIETVLASYGEQWRAEPRPAGTGLWAWILPPGMLLGGLAMVGVVLARRRRLEPEVVYEEVDPGDEERLRAALKELDKEEEPAF